MAKEFGKAMITNRTLKTMNEQGVEDGWTAVRQCYSKLTKGWNPPKKRGSDGQFRTIKATDNTARAAIVHRKHGYRWAAWRIRKYLMDKKHPDMSPMYNVTPVWKIIHDDVYVYYFVYARPLKAASAASA